MIFNTRNFGYVEIKDEDAIQFPEGIYAFEDEKEFAILKHNDDDEDPVLWLQSTKNEHLSFIIFNPNGIVENYHADIPDEILKKLQVDDLEDLRFFVIAIVPKNVKDTTVNLKSPIVINSAKNIGMQVILENDQYPIRHKVFEDSGKVEEICS